MENALIVVRSISASLILGFFLARSLSKTDLLLAMILAPALVFCGLAIFYEQNISFITLGQGVLILNIFVGMTLGLVLSAPILAVDFFAEGIQAIFKSQVNTLKLVSSLGFCIALCDLEFFSYFFSLLAQSSKLLNLPASGSSLFPVFLFPSLLYFVLPLFAAILALYLFFSFMQSVLPSLISPGLKEAFKMLFVLSALVFVFSSTRTYFYDFMHELSKQAFK